MTKSHLKSALSKKSTTKTAPSKSLPLATRILQKILFPSSALSQKEKNHLAQLISGKTILITGASYGIGEQLSYVLAEAIKNKHQLAPVTFLLVGRTTQKLQHVQEKIMQQVVQQGSIAKIYTIDLRDSEQLQGFQQYLDTLSIDIFINNAGQSIKRPIMKSLERSHDCERTIKINYLAPVKLCLHLIPQLRNNQGHIINVSALNVLLPPMPEWSAYQASKTSFDQWFRCASPELQVHNIDTSTLYLPLVRTRMIAPTALYRSAPAMTPAQVAGITVRLIINKKTTFKPWWLYPVEVLAVLFTKPLEMCVRMIYRYTSKR